MRSQFERSKRALPGRPPSIYRAWVGAAGVLIASLIGALFWIAQDNLTRPHTLPVAESKPTPAIALASFTPPAAPKALPPLVMLQPEVKKPVPPKPAPVARPARPAKVAVRPVVAKAPKRVAPPPAKTEAAEPDSDVALITAVVGYGKRHQKDSACPAVKKCKPVDP
jgi:hypothetical protein